MKSGYEVIREGGTLDEAVAVSAIGPGWNKLIDMVRTYLVPTNPDIKFYQIKEKFAGLRIYASPLTDLDQDFLWIIESASKHVCEECGEAARVRIDHTEHRYAWHKTLCQTHAQEKGYVVDELERFGLPNAK